MQFNSHTPYIIGGILIFILLLLIVFLFFTFTNEPSYIPNNETKLEKVRIQPKEAIEIAQPYIDEHATYEFKGSQKMRTHIVKHKKWYYIKKTNYPAKTYRYYMHKCVKVNSKNGKVKIVK